MPTNKTTRPWCYWEESRQMWRAYERMPDGKYHNIRAQTQKELRAKIDATRADIQHQIDAAAVQEEAAKYPTVADVAEQWRKTATSSLSVNGKAAIDNAIDNHIVPALGNKIGRDVLPADIDTMMLTMDGMSQSSRSKVLLTTRRIFDYMVENGYAIKNPCAKKKAGGTPAAEKTALTDEQADRLLQALDNKQTRRAYLFCALGLYTGLRREEILGLAWDDVHLDTDAPYLTVSHTVTFEGSRGVRKPTVKTDAARRNLPIPEPLLKILKEEKADTTRELVVCQINGSSCSRQSFRKLWDAVVTRSIRSSTEKIGDVSVNHPDCVKTLDFYVSPHVLRHTYITNICAKSAKSGLSIKDIQYLAGHANPTITLKIYAHVMQEHSSARYDGVNAVFASTK